MNGNKRTLPLQLIDKNGHPIFEPVFEEWEHIDHDKQHKLLMEHFQVIHPGKRLIDIEPEEDRWRLIDEIKEHLYENHIKEILRKAPVRLAMSDIKKRTTIVSVRNEKTGKVTKFTRRRIVNPGDIVAIRLDAA